MTPWFRIPLYLACSGVLAASGGCAKDGGGVDAGDIGEGGTGETGADDGGEIIRTPAHGVRIAEVYANQAVRVKVADGEMPVLTNRTAPLMKQKTTLLRAMLEVEDGWVPRPVEVEIKLEYPDGREESTFFELTVEGDSEDADPGSSVFAPIPGEYIEAGMKFQINLYDLDDSLEGTPTFGAVSSPAVPDLLGIESDDLGIEVVLAPVYHDRGADCPDVPEPTENDLELMSRWLLAHNPADHVDVTVGPTLTYSNSVSNGFNGLLNFLAAAREEAGVAPGAYFYGLIRTCNETPMVPGVGAIDGQAIAVNDFNFIDDPSLRVAAGRWRTDVLTDGTVQVEKSVLDTLVHEIGHTQGRAHSPCDAPGADNNYPYPDADIGVWAFDTLNNLYYSPSGRKDYMSYCNPVWVSDYVYLKVYPFIDTISGWDMGDQAPTPEQTLLYGVVDHEGNVEWRTGRGTMPLVVEQPVDALIDGVVSRAAWLSPSEALDGGMVVVELPEHWLADDLALAPGTGAVAIASPHLTLSISREALRANTDATRAAARHALAHTLTEE